MAGLPAATCSRLRRDPDKRCDLIKAEVGVFNEQPKLTTMAVSLAGSSRPRDYNRRHENPFPKKTFNVDNLFEILLHLWNKIGLTRKIGRLA